MFYVKGDAIYGARRAGGETVYVPVNATKDATGKLHVKQAEGKIEKKHPSGAIPVTIDELRARYAKEAATEPGTQKEPNGGDS